MKDCFGASYKAMTFFSLSQLTVLANTKLKGAIPPHKLDILVTEFDDCNCLCLHVKQPPLTLYQNEQSMFGKTIRLVHFLMQDYALLQWLLFFNVERVMVSEASTPQLFNNQNTMILKTTFLKEIYDGYESFRRTNVTLAEQNIKKLIAENAHL
jgi:hypothetical protein